MTLLVILAEFFGIEEDLKELDGAKLGQVLIRIFGTKKALTDQEEKLWISKSEGHLGNQVKMAMGIMCIRLLAISPQEVAYSTLLRCV